MFLLNVSDGQGNLLRNAPAAILAWMHFPSSPSNREQFAAAIASEWIKRGPTVPAWGTTEERADKAYTNWYLTGGYELKARLFDLLENGISRSDLRKPSLRNADRGLMAGTILCDLVAIGRKASDLASVHRVATLRSQKKWGRLGREREIMGVWAEFGSVANLWVAIIHEKIGGRPTLLHRLKNLDDQQILDFLGLAAAFSREGSRYLKRSFDKKKLAMKFWSEPRDLLPPLRRLYLPELSPAELRALQRL